PFLRISVVLHFLRQVLGTQTSPSNQVLIGLSLFLSLVVMQPVLNDMYKVAWVPVEKNEMTMSQAADAATPVLKTFMIRFAREKDIRLFVEMSHAPQPANPGDVGLSVLV